MPGEALPKDFDSWVPMSIDRYAALESAAGLKVTKQGDVFWQQVRPFFYRPLAPYCGYDQAATARQFGKLAAFQHGVLNGQPSNSYLNFIVFDDLRNYDPGKLHRNAQRNLRAAQKNGLVAARLADEKQFVEQGYELYLSFYRRAKYEFATQRTRKEGFAQWARALFQFPDMPILGAFQGDKLLGFEMSCRIGDTVIRKTMVHSDKGLELRAPDLLLHHCRVAAREDPSITLVYDSGLSTHGIDEYKLRRGAHVTAIPAYLHVNPILLGLIKKFGSTSYQRLGGIFAQRDSVVLGWGRGVRCALPQVRSL
jgi:hypothetical protein